MDTVYAVLCQLVIGYCIPAWAETYKTFFLKLEKAHMALLKIMHHKPRYKSTTELYWETRALSVRQLFILRTMLRWHSQLPLINKVVEKRRGALVCFSIPCRSNLTTRQYSALNSRLYKDINKKNWITVWGLILKHYRMCWNHGKLCPTISKTAFHCNLQDPVYQKIFVQI